MQQFCRGKAIVQLDEIEVMRADPGSFVGALGGKSAQRIEVWCRLRSLGPRVGRQHRCRDPDCSRSCRRTKLPQEVVRDNHGRGSPVTGRSAHEHRVGTRHRGRRKDLLERVRLLVHRVRIVDRVGVILLGDLGEHLFVGVRIAPDIIHCSM